MIIHFKDAFPTIKGNRQYAESIYYCYYSPYFLLPLSLASLFPILSLTLFPSPLPLPLSFCPPLFPFPCPHVSLPPLTLTASPAMSHGSLSPLWLPKGSGCRQQRQTQARGRRGRLSGPGFARRSDLVLDFRVLLGLEHAFVEPPAIIFGNDKRPALPEDWERINVVLPIFAKRGERLILVILSRSFNIWETLHYIFSQPVSARILS